MQQEMSANLWQSGKETTNWKSWWWRYIIPIIKGFKHENIYRYFRVNIWLHYSYKFKLATLHFNVVFIHYQLANYICSSYAFTNCQLQVWCVVHKPNCIICMVTIYIAICNKTFWAGKTSQFSTFSSETAGVC